MPDNNDALNFLKGKLNQPSERHRDYDDTDIDELFDNPADNDIPDVEEDDIVDIYEKPAGVSPAFPESGRSNPVKYVSVYEIDDSDNAAENGNRSMDMEDIRVLAESIKLSGGILQPVTLYLGNDGNYRIISGYRRVAAMKLLLREAEYEWSNDMIPAIILNPPGDGITKRIYMAQANTHRSRPEEIKQECVNANEIWLDIKNSDPERYKYWRSHLKERFNEKHSTDKEFVENPVAYRDKYYRPPLEFIKLITGLEVSNPTIKNYLKDIGGTQSDEDVENGEIIYVEDESAAESKEPKKKKVTGKSLVKQIQKLIDNINDYHVQTGIELDFVATNLLTELMNYKQMLDE